MRVPGRGGSSNHRLSVESGKRRTQYTPESRRCDGDRHRGSRSTMEISLNRGRSKRRTSPSPASHLVHCKRIARASVSTAGSSSDAQMAASRAVSRRLGDADPRWSPDRRMVAVTRTNGTPVAWPSSSSGKGKANRFRIPDLSTGRARTAFTSRRSVSALVPRRPPARDRGDAASRV